MMSPFLLFAVFFSLPPPAALLSASAAATVTHLPGFVGPLPFSLETGYVTVDEDKGAELFYYFIASEGNPAADPVLLWLTGGTRCSSLTGLAFEVGPVRFALSRYNGSIPNLVYNPYSLTKVASVLFVDSPVGAGFSFSRDYQGYYVGDVAASAQLHSFLLNWFSYHPQFLSNPFYIAGDSYAGIYVPVVAQEISQGNEAGGEPFLNLQGYVLGNPRTGEKVDHNSQIPYARGMGIISDELAEAVEQNCVGQDIGSPTTQPCSLIVDDYNKFFSELDCQHILAPKCDDEPVPGGLIHSRRSTTEESPKLKLLNPPTFPSLQCRSYGYALSYYWANDVSTREALRIKKGTKEEWQKCNYEFPLIEEITSTIKYHLNLTTRGYRALIFSGDHDLMIPFPGTLAWIKSLNFSVLDAWRSWKVDGQVAGYTTSFSNNLTFATVKGAGHTAPEYKPQECLEMIKRWISFMPL